MTCLAFIAALGEYLEQELALAQRQALLDHARTCPPCCSYLESYLATVRLLRLACGPSLDPHVRRGVS